MRPRHPQDTSVCQAQGGEGTPERRERERHLLLVLVVDPLLHILEHAPEQGEAPHHRHHLVAHSVQAVVNGRRVDGLLRRMGRGGIQNPPHELSELLGVGTTEAEGHRGVSHEVWLGAVNDEADEHAEGLAPLQAQSDTAAPVQDPKLSCGRAPAEVPGVRVHMREVRGAPAEEQPADEGHGQAQEDAGCLLPARVPAAAVEEPVHGLPPGQGHGDR
mmetsp:Transcript_94566/g.294572  ORF Transcript_94566/g.294572 Transcript_94566/m.294572 type:complete len:217 (+) Transcript_94566:118-768(+)